MTDLHQVFKLKNKIKESDIVTTYILNGTIDCKPGQFFMIWLKGIDEKPISVGYVYDDSFALTVAAIGPFTKKLEELEIGEKMFLRGPFGTGFDLNSGNHYIAIGGGVGVPPVAFASQELRKRDVNVDFIQGARSFDLLIYRSFLEEIGTNVYMCTDDGSDGHCGYTTDKFIELLADYKNKGIKITNVISCGPEVMMKKVAEISKDNAIDCELSIERYMKCGFGVCGQCAIDGSGDLACLNGPVFDGKKLLKSNEFGVYSRDCSGKKRYL